MHPHINEEEELVSALFHIASECEFWTYFKLMLCALYSMTVFMGSDITLVMVSLPREGKSILIIHLWLLD